jgi:TonB family protein
MPTFQGGDRTAFQSWVMMNVRYPKIAAENGITGRVMVQFVVERDGSVSNITVLQSPDRSLSEEAVRVISSSPKWTPGTQRGHLARVKFIVPIDFQIPAQPTAQAQPTASAPTAPSELVVVGAGQRKKPAGTENDTRSWLFSQSTPVPYTMISPTTPLFVPSTASTEKPEDSPLVFVDGVKMEQGFNILPDNAEHIAVIKDKSALEVYGEEGKNGVILVTTKK